MPDNPPIIQYARFDGETWFPPVDIYVGITRGTSLGFPGVMLDSEEILHLIWTVSQQGPAYYMHAPLHGASTAQAWSEPVLIDLPVYLPQLHVDSKGTLHLLYASYWGDPPDISPGVYYVRSEDSGRTWTEPYWLDPDARDDDVPQILRMVADEADGLHAVWWYNNIVDPNVDDKWVRYAHLLDGGQTWSEPMTIEQGTEGGGNSLSVAGPVLAVNGREIHVVWAGGERPNRKHRYSLDAGQTWTVVQRITAFGDLEGQAFDALGVDGIGRLHFMGQLRFPEGVYHSVWDRDQWSEPELVYLLRWDSTETWGDRIVVHNIDLAFRAGNQVVITFTDPPPEDQRGLYTMHRILDYVSPSPVLPTPMLADSRFEPTPRPEPSRTDLPLTPTPRPTVAEDSLLPSPPESSLPGDPFLWGVVPVVLLLLSMVVVFQWRRQR